MSELSVDPRLAKAILASAGELACSQEVATIVAMLSVHSVWAGAHRERKAQNEAKMRQAPDLCLSCMCLCMLFVYVTGNQIWPFRPDSLTLYLMRVAGPDCVHIHWGYDAMLPITL